MLRITIVAVCALLFTTVGTLRPALTQPAAPTFAAYIYDTTGKQLGTAWFVGVDNGVQVRIDVTGLPPGKHGMHIHEVGSCNPLRDMTGKATPFGAAGGHFDPQGTSHHLGPYGAGHAGDLPNLNVNDYGHARTTFFDDRLSIKDGPMNIVGRAIVIHANEDNYTDTPPLGGSGPRIACGEIGPLRVSLEGMKTVVASASPPVTDVTLQNTKVVYDFPSGDANPTAVKSSACLLRTPIAGATTVSVTAERSTMHLKPPCSVHFEGHVVIKDLEKTLTADVADFDFTTSQWRMSGATTH